MGINVRVQKSPKPLDVIEVQAKLERDLRSCMRCRFFYGNNRQCIAKKCVKEDEQPKAVEQKKEDECIGCPYRTCHDCEKDCKIYKRYQKRLARMEEDKEQERYLQEYAKRKQEKKNRKEGKR